MTSLEDLISNDFEVLLKVLAYISPEVLYDCLEVEQISIENVQKITSNYYQQKETDAIKDERTGRPKELKRPSNSKVCVMCEYFIQNQTLSNKQIFIVNNVFKLTNRIDLLDLNFVISDLSQWKTNSEAKPLAEAAKLQLSKCLACLLVARPMMNTHNGIKFPGLKSTFLVEQIEQVEKFYSEEQQHLKNFSQSDYEELEKYLVQFQKKIVRVETALQFINLCERVYQDTIKARLVHFAQAANAPFKLYSEITGSNVAAFDMIDEQIEHINFKDTALLIRCSQLNNSWVRRIKASLKENFNVPFKQFLISVLRIMDGKPRSSEIKGYISYFKMSWFLKTLNFDTMSLTNDEIEHVLFQFVFLKIQEEAKRVEVLKRKQDDAKKLETELSAEEEEQAKTAQKKSVSDFMIKMKNKINNVNANYKDIDLELDDSDHHHEQAVMQPHAAQDTDQIRMKIEQQRKSMLQRQNLYNWKFSIADLVEILIAFIFNT